MTTLDTPFRVQQGGADSIALYAECLQEVTACVDATAGCPCCSNAVLVQNADDIKPITLDQAHAEVEEAVSGEGSDGVPKDDPFIKEELKLAALLLWAMLRQWIDGGAQRVLLDAAASESAILTTNAIDDAERIMSNTVRDQDIHEDVESILAQGIINGVALVAADQLTATGILSLMGDVKNIPWCNSMESIVEHYANGYMQRIISPRLLSQIQASVNAPAGQSLLSIVNRIEGRYIGQSASYWRMVANAHTSRTYTYGALRGGWLAGRRGYRLVNPMDRRTTRLCQSLNGREFWIATAVNLMEHAADGGHDGMVAAMPWLPANTDVSNMTNQQLANQGVMVPPFHGHCRTVIYPIY